MSEGYYKEVKGSGGHCRMGKSLNSERRNTNLCPVGRQGYSEWKPDMMAVTPLVES